MSFWQKAKTLSYLEFFQKCTKTSLLLPNHNLLSNFSVVSLVVFAASENLEKPLVWVPDPLVVEAPAAEAEAEAIPPEVRDVVEAPVNDGLRPPSPDIFR